MQTLEISHYLIKNEVEMIHKSNVLKFFKEIYVYLIYVVIFNLMWIFFFNPIWIYIFYDLLMISKRKIQVMHQHFGWNISHTQMIVGWVVVRHLYD